MQVPDSDLSPQTAGSKNVIAVRVKSNTPWSSWVSSQCGYALIGTKISDMYVMITMRGSNFGPEINTSDHQNTVRLQLIKTGLPIRAEDH